ncbi:hypothetical protein V6N12_006544 [Hibiscus sabdariffa]|uniref:Uncharacterized protein n=1 Tax=Hibiscus sabdariffa TaxID=183260 RepID=A0ABR2EZ39_9ROSI
MQFTMVTEEGNSNTETVRSLEPTNVPTQVARTSDKQPKKRKYVAPRASPHILISKRHAMMPHLEELDDTEFTKSVNILKDNKNAITFLTIEGPQRLLWSRSLWQAS